MTSFHLKATARNELGTGASRRLRRANQFIPAIVYGGEKAPQPIALEQREFYRILGSEETIYTAIIKLEIDGQTEQVILKDMQRHPFKPRVQHLDFQRVDAEHEVTVLVPFHFLNEEVCVGVKQQGGQIQHLLNEVEITALPQNLPSSIDLDLAALEIGQILHLSDLSLPEGVQITALAHGGDTGIVSVVQPKRGNKEEAEGSEGDTV